MASEEIPRDEAEAALEARRELGRDYEPAVVDSFVERLDEVIEKRVAETVSRQSSGDDATARARAELEKTRSEHRLALIIVSMALGIPLTAIAGGMMGPAGIVMIWVSLVMLNVIYGLGGLGGRRG